MQLKEGKMSGQDIAKWMNISYKNTYAKKPKRFLDILSNYCDHEPCRGGTIITKVYIDTYVKNLGAIDDKKVYEEVRRCEKEQDGLGSISGMAEKFAFQEGEKVTTMKVRVANSANRMFGKFEGIESFGPIGNRKRQWAIKLGKYNTYRNFTEEEKQLFDELTKKYYQGRGIESIQEEALLVEAFITTDMTKEDFLKEHNRIYGFFNKVLGEFKELTGYSIARAAKHEIIDYCPKLLKD